MIKTVQQLKGEYIESQCEKMEGVEDRYEVYENDGELVADWWCEEIKKRDLAHRDAIIEVLEAKKIKDLPSSLIDPSGFCKAVGHNQALDQAIEAVKKIYQEGNE